MATQIQLRRGTAAQWTSANPVLAEGELGLETDTGSFKIGNGIDNWSSLVYGFEGLPSGGTTGQILAKDSSSDYDFAWIDNYTEEVGLTVRNTTGSTLTKGTVVYINGGNSSRITVAKAIATSEATSAGTIGMVKNDIPNNTNGIIITSGSVTGLNTNGLTGGAPLWLSESTAGTWTSTVVSPANHLVLIGYVENVNSSNGSVYIKTATFPEMDELTGVSLSSLSNNEVLTYESSTGLWKNKSVPLQSVSVLTDVNITGLSDNNILRYDSATSKWLAEALPVGVQNLNDLTDVTVSGTPTNGQVLSYDTATSQWKPATPASGGATNLDGLSDVTIASTPTNGQVLSYDTATSQWKPATPVSGGATDLDDLSDVTISGTPTNGQVLSYDTATSQWIPATVTSGGYTQLGQVNFSGTAPSFTSIPSTYKKLVLVFTFTAVGSITGYLQMTFNANSGAIYAQTSQAAGSGTTGANASYTAFRPFITAGALVIGTQTIDINNYTAIGSTYPATINNGYYNGNGLFKSGTAVSSIEFSVSAGTWTGATGTATLYGVN